MKEIPKNYNPSESEDDIYKLWEESGFFNPDNIDSSERYCNVLPPPNANGELHVGHASGYTVMDIFGRYERMNGKKTLLLPGKDHAGIQTQVVYEKKIKKERGIARDEIGREKFYDEVYEFCMDRSGYMRSQEKRIGISADWSREKFSLDPDGLKIALETFVKMYEDGLVYKGNRIINWCPSCGTALADVEVLHKEEDGKLCYIKYPIKDSDEFISVATTRPETMLGDTAIAVNPKDEKYKDLIGKTAMLPLMNREIPIISDYRIEMGFGTGAVKITPAHDPLDWQIGKDHKLEELQVIDEMSEITDLGGKYAGQKVMEARRNVFADLSDLGLLEKEEDLKINKSICERCKTVIEPLISKQWFVNVDAKKYSLKKEAIKALKEGKINVYPKNFENILINWYENLNDWCISRQIWWGPQFPVWYKGEEIYVGLEAPDGGNPDSAKAMTGNPDSAKATTGEWVQDENTFDTWFSSGQWPYTTLGFPEGKDYKQFYPTDMMIMGRDILPFWAARMIMFGLYKTGNVPFKNLYFTGLIRDKEGHKFSKSRGNGIDPLPMIDKYGADALRLSLVMDTTPGQDARLYEEKIERFRNFTTKLWNIYRYSNQSDENFNIVEEISTEDLKTVSDRWVVSELQKTIQETTKFIEAKNISLAQEKLRVFTWDILADWYVEINKIEKNAKVLGYVFDKILKLWHPFIPFITEKIFQDFHAGKKLLMVSAWPKADESLIDENVSAEFDNLKNIITRIRNIRSSYRIDAAMAIDAYGAEVSGKEIIERLARVKIVGSASESGNFMRISEGDIALDLDIAKLIDVEKEKTRLQNEIKNLESSITRIENTLKNEKFLTGAPKEIIEESRNRMEEYKSKLETQRELLGNLGAF
ncbi:MAG: valine--tRNA ligase [Candidatus Moranbacteria bacterium]|nr:valine--tRNA ligase [Candidatus Moranbacteria bacterium]